MVIVETWYGRHGSRVFQICTWPLGPPVTAAGRRLLAHGRSVRLTGKVSFTPAGLPASSQIGTFTLNH